MKELEALILKRRFFYNDPMFTWMMGNVVAKIDKKDNIYPDKERVENKIDDVVATIMAMNRWMASREDSMPDDYELTVA
jgi:phage terminase large subunit-like protein